MARRGSRCGGAAVLSRFRSSACGGFVAAADALSLILRVSFFFDSALFVAGRQLIKALGRRDFDAKNRAKKNGSELPPRLPIVRWKIGRAFPIRF